MADESEKVGQDEIEAMLRESNAGDGAAASESSDASSVAASAASLNQDEVEALSSSPPASPSAQTPPESPATSTPPLGDDKTDMDVLLSQAEAALASIDQDTRELPKGVRAFTLDDFSGTPASTEAATLDLMRDVQLDVTIELGRTHMHLEEVLKLQQGAVVPLDKLAGDPVDIYVNGRLVARGEVLVLNDNFCVRVAELVVGDNAA